MGVIVCVSVRLSVCVSVYVYKGDARMPHTRRCGAWILAPPLAGRAKHIPGSNMHIRINIASNTSMSGTISTNTNFNSTHSCIFHYKLENDEFKGF